MRGLFLGFAFLFFFLSARLSASENSIFPSVDGDRTFLNAIIRLETDETVSGLFVKGADFYLPMPFFQFGTELFGRVEISISVPDFTAYTLEISKEKKLLIPLLSCGNLLFAENAPAIALETQISGEYQVQPGDYLYKIAQTWLTSVAFLEIINQTGANIHPGQILKIGIVKVSNSPFTLLIKLSECRLQVYYMEKLLKTYSVAVGRGQSTKTGEYFITRKIPNPALYWEGEFIQPLAPINGLGTWWLELSNPQYGIHGTNRPWEIGKRISHGCIRLLNEEIDLLQKILPVGTKVEILP